MITCQTVSEELWDWLRNDAAHPLDADLSRHVAGCAECRRLAAETRLLLPDLATLRLQAPLGFEASLQTRLEHLQRTGQDPAAARFESDPWLEESEPEAAGLVVDRRSPAWWRPLGLVATGAIAVLLIGLVARWQSTSPAGVVAPASSVARVGETPLPSVDPPAVSVKVDEKTGLLAERPYQDPDTNRREDSNPAARERLTPVKTTP